MFSGKTNLKIIAGLSMNKRTTKIVESYGFSWNKNLLPEIFQLVIG